ncbi:MAG: LuxR C-terminal-related transcriptional regulator [Paramuribaculum sp.]|nr:LuxR C-terminal-related transcriptional regulator [Paramuribaculum sp.]
MHVSERPYRATDKMRDLIDDNSLLLFAMSRFGIALGFGNESIKDVCESHGVDCQTFLTVANFINGHQAGSDGVDVRSLLDYLRRAHQFYLDYLLPLIGKKLVDVIGHRGENEVSGLLMRYYDEYVDEVRRHMHYENTIVFGHIEALLDRRADAAASFSEYASPHNDMTLRLRNLKDIIIRYYPQKNHDIFNSVLLDLLTCEKDLATHCRIEDELLSPCVQALEKAYRDSRDSLSSPRSSEMSVSSRLDLLTPREREVIKCVVRGMSNKEIADSLCLSFHTVTTYRHKISVKLNIHSSAGLTVFAIMNKLVNIDEINPV